MLHGIVCVGSSSVTNYSVPLGGPALGILDLGVHVGNLRLLSGPTVCSEACHVSSGCQSLGPLLGPHFCRCEAICMLPGGAPETLRLSQRPQGLNLRAVHPKCTP